MGRSVVARRQPSTPQTLLTGTHSPGGFPLTKGFITAYRPPLALKTNRAHARWNNSVTRRVLFGDL